MERSKARNRQKRKGRIQEGRQLDQVKAECEFLEGPKIRKLNFESVDCPLLVKPWQKTAASKIGRTKPVYHTAVAGQVAGAILGERENRKESEGESPTYAAADKVKTQVGSSEGLQAVAIHCQSIWKDQQSRISRGSA